jgi:hypothetical protein
VIAILFAIVWGGPGSRRKCAELFSVVVDPYADDGLSRPKHVMNR